LGDPRVNQNPGVLALAIVFYRWHNYHAMIVKSNHPEWVDEDVFQAARRRVISTLQVKIKSLKHSQNHGKLENVVVDNVGSIKWTSN
jgi:hypothetical protein